METLREFIYRPLVCDSEQNVEQLISTGHERPTYPRQNSFNIYIEFIGETSRKNPSYTSVGNIDS